MNTKSKKVLSAALAISITAGLSSNVLASQDIGNIITKVADTIKETIPEKKVEKVETIYKIIYEGTNDDVTYKDIQSFVTNTKSGEAFNAVNIQADLDAIQSSGLVKSASARTIQSNGHLFVVFSVIPLEKDTWKPNEKLVDLSAVKDAAGRTFEPTKVEDVTSSQDNQDKKDKKNKLSKEKSADKATSLATSKPSEEISISNNALENVEGKDTVTDVDSDSNATTSQNDKSVSDEDFLSNYIIEDIEFEGFTKTKSWVVSKLIEQYAQKGEHASKAKLQMLYDELWSTRYFKELDLKLVPGTTKDSVIVEIIAQEDKTGEWSLGVGASSQNKVQAIGTIRDINLGGEGQSLGLDFGIGTKKQNFNISYVNPFLRKSDTKFYINGFMNQRDLTWENIDYTEKRTGGSIGISKPLKKGSKAQYFIDFTAQNIDSNNSTLGDLTANTLTFGVQENNVDNIVNPTKGYSWTASVTSSMKSLGSDYNYTKYHIDARGYNPVSEKGVLAGRLSYNYSPDNVPLLEQFTIGGVDSIRGLDDDYQRGNKSLLGTFEYRQKFNEWLQGAIFVDFGQAWSSKNTDNSFEVSPGVGLRATTKMGILRFDVAKTKDHNAKFVFGIGQSF